MSMLIPTAAGAVSKVFLKQWCNEVRVTGLPTFLDKLNSDRGVLTIANHISVDADLVLLTQLHSVDEPFMWGCLPISLFMDTRTTRWTLGASDMMFTGKWDSWFFSRGQVMETLRGKGIYQKAIDRAAKKLNDGQWVHVFPEGMIKQDTLNELRRFKWGISRLLFETDPERMPHVVPVWIKGFQEVMDERRGWPRMLPRPGKNVSIMFGNSINSAIDPLMAKYRTIFPNPWRPATYGNDVKEDLRVEPEGLAAMRSELAARIRDELMKLGNDGRLEKMLEQKPNRIRWNRLE
ncbi:BQ5605_C002g01312 [Microbotryum silenes-dioicae]|uniref:Tafazzin family protein n=1 Tax=Microbotryum silenes-dioicae TaxID=796604 RepID=A0A2X0M280_9BASI|nr:BQ5605_C002g01312 [Microbotryum silenes-dioicae]